MAYRWLAGLLTSARCSRALPARALAPRRSAHQIDAKGSPAAAALLSASLLLLLISGCSGTEASNARGTGGSDGTVASICTDPATEEDPCESDTDCPFGGVCISTGCKTEAGTAVKSCVSPWGPSCEDAADCPVGDYECRDVGAGQYQCVRTTAGCSPETEHVDCAPGYLCEGATCVDRRLPCSETPDCPKSHVCHTTLPGASFCVHTFRTCEDEFDCVWMGVTLGSACEDVDGDGRRECIGFLPNTEDLDPPPPCLNSSCGAEKVCESASGGNASQAECGDYGLCLTDGDCAAGFDCVALWPNGRKECVPSESALCDEQTDCLAPRVCASPWDGGPPSCQSGEEPT